MKVSIIIVHYHAKRFLFDCIKSIIETKPQISYEVIVVDNDEESEIKEKLTRKFRFVNYIKSPGNIGFGAGNNLGAKAAKGEHLFFLNPDTIVFPKTIDVLTSFLKKNKNAGVIAPLLLDKEEKVYQQGSLELTPKRGIVALSFINKVFPNNKISKDYFLRDWDKKETKEVDTVPGTAFMTKRDIFERVGGFDEQFFLYFEEDDLCRRIRKLGFRNYICPQAKVVHLGGVSSRGIKGLNKVFEKSRFLYFRKHFGLLNAVFIELFLRPRIKDVIMIMKR